MSDLAHDPIPGTGYGHVRRLECSVVGGRESPICRKSDKARVSEVAGNQGAHIVQLFLGGCVFLGVLICQQFCPSHSTTIWGQSGDRRDVPNFRSQGTSRPRFSQREVARADKSANEMVPETTVQRFDVPYSEAAVEDLRQRLARTRWPEQIPGSQWDYG